jgi:hypothetical protein
MKLNSLLQTGFKWRVEHIRGSRLLGVEITPNLVPTEGLNDLLSVWLKNGSQHANWYIALFEGNYTPVNTITAATFATGATECSAYAETTRPAWTGGTVAAGAVNNSAAKAEFTMNANKTVYGGALISSSTKGGTSGVLGSIVRFSTSKGVENGDILRLTGGITAVSA